MRFQTLTRYCVLALLAAYLSAPFFAGFLNTDDPRGPVIYHQSYHRALHRLGAACAGRGKPRIPLRNERPTFYGLDPAEAEDLFERGRNEETKEKK